MGSTCGPSHPMCELMYQTNGQVQLSGIYKVMIGKRQGMPVWVVDRDTVVRSLYPEFIMGGNDQRYRFNPLNEVWIDGNMGVEELEYTIAHELIERKLMREKGWSYNRAHTEGGLALEEKMRASNERRVLKHSRYVGELYSESGVQASGSLMPPICALNIYRRYVGTRKGVSVWIVDGPKVRKELDPNFCYGTHDLKSDFIPANEIWLDSAMSVLEVHYTLQRARRERALLASGLKWGTAYETAQCEELKERARQARRVLRHEAKLAPVSLGVRSKGAKDAQ